MKRLSILLAILALGLGAGLVAGCGDKTKTVTEKGANGQITTRTVANVHFAKTKFLLHSALAFGAFHRYIYKPLRAHGFSSGAPKRKRTIFKAGLAAVFIVHELKQA